MDYHFCLVVDWPYTAQQRVYIECISFSMYSLDKLDGFFFLLQVKLWTLLDRE